MTPLALVLLVAWPAAAAVSAPAVAATAAPEVATELERGVQAYNAQDIAYYESALTTDAVFIADDGAIFAGKERVLRQFTRVFGMTPKRQITVSDVVTGGKGDVGWARFKWTLAGGESSRAGVATTLFVRGGDGRWQVQMIHNTRSGHAHGGAPPAPAPTPTPTPHKH